MKSFVYPAVFIKNDQDNSYNVLFPDLQITTDGAFVEEAFLYAKEALRTYFAYVSKYDLDFNMPTDFARVKKSCRMDELVMLIDAEVHKNDLV